MSSPTQVPPQSTTRDELSHRKAIFLRDAVRFGKVMIQPGALRAVCTWPVFSISSFEMLSALLSYDVRPASIIDVGANVGQFTVAAAKKIPNAHVHSFEPLPDCASRLRRNVDRLRNVSVYGLALGETEGRCAMHVNSYTLSSSLLSLAPAHQQAFPYETEVGTLDVAVSTLDKTFERIDLPRPILLKIDVQGYEAKVLKGAANLLKGIDHAVIEASLKPMYEGETLFDGLADLMKAFGFRFKATVGQLPDPSSGEILQIDALFERVS
jgi:FkbM family methyltransferase